MPYLPISFFDSNYSEPKLEIKSFFWRNQKITMSLAARSALNLYECAVSASNADLTLWIFKEQPIIEINQLTQSTLKEDALH